ncbi:MAG: hypothetical protein V4660_19755 [Pseudomonadota bacterium]
MKRLLAFNMLGAAVIAAASASVSAEVSCTINRDLSDSKIYKFEYRVRNIGTTPIKDWSVNMLLPTRAKNITSITGAKVFGFPDITVQRTHVTQLSAGSSVKFTISGNHPLDKKFTPPDCTETRVPVNSVRIDPDRSLFVHDLETLDKTGITLQNVLDTLASELTSKNPADPVDGTTLFNRMWNLQNPVSVENPEASCKSEMDVANSDESIRTLPVECRPQEGKQALDPTAISKYQLISLVNRFDLHDRNFESCGEYRMIFAVMGQPEGRNLIIFEADLKNNIALGEGCLAVQNFWKDLSVQGSADVRGQRLAHFYRTGIPEFGIRAPISVESYTTGRGQIRTNQFLESTPSWVLKEYQFIPNSSRNALEIVPVKDNPVGALMNDDTAEARTFRNRFLDNMQTLLGDANTFGFSPRITDANNIQSHSSGPLLADNMYRNVASADFKDAIQARLVQLNVSSTISPDQLLNRATGLTCGGCHMPAFIDTLPIETTSAGTTFLLPTNLFTHVDETTVVDGKFVLSDALNLESLPHRKKVLENFLGGTIGETVIGEQRFFPADLNITPTGGVRLTPEGDPDAPIVNKRSG